MKWSSPETLMSVVALLIGIAVLVGGIYFYKKTSKRVEDLEKQNPAMHTEIQKLQQSIRQQESNMNSYFRNADAKMDERFGQLIQVLKSKDPDLALPEPRRHVNFAHDSYHGYSQQPPMNGYGQAPGYGPPPMNGYGQAPGYGPPPMNGYGQPPYPQPYGPPQDVSALLSSLS